MFRFSRFLLPFVYVFLIFCFSLFVFADDVSNTDLYDVTTSSVSETIQAVVTSDVNEIDEELTPLQDNQQLIVERLDLIYTAILFFVSVFAGGFVCYILYKLLDNFLTF